VALNKWKAKVRKWHFASFAAPHHFVAYWSNNGQWSVRMLNRYAAIDPERRLAVRLRCNAAREASVYPGL